VTDQACGDCKNYEAGDETSGACWKMTIVRDGRIVPALAFARETGECDGFERASPSTRPEST
jgi:hypothetical protein